MPNAGDVDAGIRLAEQVEEMARSMDEPARNLELLDSIAEALEEVDQCGPLDRISELAAKLAAGDKKAPQYVTMGNTGRMVRTIADSPGWPSGRRS